VSPGRPRSRRGEGAALREEILEAAEALLLETGSEDAVSIRAVADRVGVTAPSIYRHFADKGTLLFEVCDRQFARFHEYLDAKRSGHADPVEALKACGRAYIEFGLTYPEHYRIMFMGRSDLTPEQYQDHVLAEQASFMALVASVQECVDAGRLRRDAFETATLLWTATHGVTSLLIAKPNFPWPPVDVLVQQVLETVESGLFTPAPDDPR
jgi:AcrR family transcriptional regulator